MLFENFRYLIRTNVLCQIYEFQLEMYLMTNFICKLTNLYCFFFLRILITHVFILEAVRDSIFT